MTPAKAEGMPNSRRPDRSTPDDPRAIRSRSRIQSALLGLLRTHPMETVTATELIRRSGVSRSTFYAHYSTVEEVLDDAASALEGFVAGGSPGLPDLVARLFGHVADHRPLAAALLAAEGPNSPAGRRGALLVQEVAGRLDDSDPLAAHAVAAALVAVLRWWVNDPTPPIPDDTARRFVALWTPTVVSSRIG